MQKRKLGSRPCSFVSKSMEKKLSTNTRDNSAHGADDGNGRFVFTFEAIGTRWEIETREPLGFQLKQRILERIEQFDATYSRFRQDSLVPSCCRL